MDSEFGVAVTRGAAGGNFDTGSLLTIETIDLIYRVQSAILQGINRDRDGLSDSVPAGRQDRGSSITGVAGGLRAGPSS
jgi:hypothetical protein